MILSQFSIKHPFVVCVFWVIIILGGIHAFRSLPVEHIPKSKSPSFTISTIYPGADQKKVLKEVTAHLEDHIREVRDVNQLLSTSQNELSILEVYFKEGTKEETAFQRVALAVNNARKNLPQSGITSPEITVLNIDQEPYVVLALTSEMNPQDLYFKAKHIVKYKMKELKDVSKVTLIGGQENQLEILLDQEKMKEREISASEIMKQLKNYSQNTYIGENYSILVEGALKSAEEIANTSIRFYNNEKPTLLSDVAQVKMGKTLLQSYTFFNGKRCLIMKVYERLGSNELNIMGHVADTLKDLSNRWETKEKSIDFHFLRNDGDKLNALFFNFKLNTLLAVFFAMIMVALTFKDFVSVFVSFFSIPSSVAGALIFTNLWGLSFNLFTFLTLIISIGFVIDDMIVVRENIFQYSEKGHSPYEATMLAMKEITFPVFTTTLMIVAVAVPLIFASGSEVAQYLPNAGYILFFTMSFSLFEAVTLGPVLCTYLIKKREKKEDRWIHKNVVKTYDYLCEINKRHPIIVIFCGTGIVALGALSFYSLKFTDFPINNVESMRVHVYTDKGITLDSINEKAKKINNEVFKDNPNIEDLGVEVDQSGTIIYYINIVQKKHRISSPDKMKEKFIKELTCLLQKKEIQNFYVASNLRVSSKKDDFGVQILGNDEEDIIWYSNKLLRDVQNMPNVKYAISSVNNTESITELTLNLEKIKKSGVFPKVLSNEINFLLNGYTPLKIYSKEISEAFNNKVLVRGDLKDPWIEKMYIPNMNGKLVPLHPLIQKSSHIEIPPIRQNEGARFIEISGDILTPHKENPANLIEKILKKSLPENLSYKWAQKSRTVRELLKVEMNIVLQGLALILLALIFLYKSVLVPFIIVLCAPIAIAGATIALKLTGFPVDLYSFIGIVISFGISAKNGVILIDYIEHRLKKDPTVEDAVYNAAKIRLRPILLTCMAILLAAIPVVIPWSDYSRDEVPMGTAIIGGLFTATFSTLFVIPATFKYFYYIDQALRRFVMRYLNPPPELKK